MRATAPIALVKLSSSPASRHSPNRSNSASIVSPRRSITRSMAAAWGIGAFEGTAARAMTAGAGQSLAGAGVDG